MTRYITDPENRPIILIIAFALIMFSLVSFGSVHTMQAEPALHLTRTDVQYLLLASGTVSAYSAMLAVLAVAWSYVRG